MLPQSGGGSGGDRSVSMVNIAESAGWVAVVTWRRCVIEQSRVVP